MNTAVSSRRPTVLEAGATTSGTAGLLHDRKTIFTIAGAALAAVVLIVVGVLIYNHRVSVSNQALADALQTFDTPVVPAGQPVPPGTKTFPTRTDRAKAALPLFQSIADNYGMLPAGRNAQYLEGVAALQAGDNAHAEEALKKSAGSWNKDVAALANMARAGLYHTTNRDADAIEIYRKLADKPTSMVPAGLAQLQLAALYDSEGKKDQARKLYAQIKDKDAKSPAGELAAQKLGEAPAR